jgi:hypothetical protein
MDWELTFHTNTKGNFTNCVSLTDSATLATNHDTLENLDTGTVTFDNADVNLEVVAGTKFRNVGTQ